MGHGAPVPKPGSSLHFYLEALKTVCIWMHFSQGLLNLELMVLGLGFLRPGRLTGGLLCFGKLLSGKKEGGRERGIVGLCEKGRGGDLIEFQTARGKIYPG